MSQSSPSPTLKPISTFTPLSLLPLPDKTALTSAFVGKSLDELRTPAVIVDRRSFRENCERMGKGVRERGMKFRVHVKTHKTAEGTRIQLQASGSKELIASTMVEVWQIIQDGMVEEGLVDDILYSLPIAPDRLEDLANAQAHVGDTATLRVMVDHPDQIRAMDAFAKRTGWEAGRRWSAFVKVDGGGRRAGCPPESEQMKDLIEAIMASHSVEIFGFYSHFGQSYASSDLSRATDYYHAEIACVNTAARFARKLGAESREKWVLSVGATPTAHAATRIREGDLQLEGELELHAGNYCMCDLQQHATSLAPLDTVAISVLATVVSLYPQRGADAELHQDHGSGSESRAQAKRKIYGEAMCDAGALAVSKDTGPIAGYGRVVSPSWARGWDLGRVSQEHGTLVRRSGASIPPGMGGEARNGDEGEEGKEAKEERELQIGDKIRIVPQHACLTCAAHHWFYVVDDEGGEGSGHEQDVKDMKDMKVADVWVPWKGW